MLRKLHTMLLILLLAFGTSLLGSCGSNDAVTQSRQNAINPMTPGNFGMSMDKLSQLLTSEGLKFHTERNRNIMCEFQANGYSYSADYLFIDNKLTKIEIAVNSRAETQKAFLSFADKVLTDFTGHMQAPELLVIKPRSWSNIVSGGNSAYKDKDGDSYLFSAYMWHQDKAVSVYITLWDRETGENNWNGALNSSMYIRVK